ncbi:MAG: hypothetical protein R3C14_53495 [Caldilineaceae bacterium]
MTSKLSPKQTLILWQLLITGDEPAISKVTPELSVKERTLLVDNGLVELVRRGRSKHMVLTDKAWAWASEQAISDLYTSKYATATLQQLIEKLQHYLQANQVPLAEFLTTNGAAAEAAADPATNPSTSTEQPVATTAPASQIRQAYRHLTEGQMGVRVRLAGLHQQLPQMEKTVLDATLRQLQLDGEVVLMPLDDPKGIRPEDEQAAINLGGELRHIVYYKG